MQDILASLTEDDRRMLVSLPYRVGMFISTSDKSGGVDASVQELDALENIVTSYVEDTCKSHFAQAVMEATLEGIESWPGWRRNIASVPQDCERVSDMLQARIDRKHLDAFKLNLVEIGLAVAVAYREQNTEATHTQLAAQIKLIIEKVKAVFLGGKKTEDMVLNISSAEKEALDTVAEKLKLPADYLRHL